MELLHRTIEFAAKAHEGQQRKGGDIPYFAHPCEVALTLALSGCDEETICAGLLHDTVEDTAVTLAEIAQRFGEGVAELVAFDSEDKSRSWTERKQRTIADVLSCEDRRRLMVTLADKLANMVSIAEDYKKLGDGVWARFNSSKEQQHWYYRSLVEAFLQRLPGEPAVEAFRDAYETVFEPETWSSEGLY